MSETTSLNRLLERMAGRGGDSVPWLGALREEARTIFAGSGLPTRRIESWKYSDLSRALARAPEGSSPARPAPILPGAHLALFKNGVLDEAKSNFAEIGAVPLRKVLADPATPFANKIGHVNPQKNHALLNLNTALMEDGIVLHVPAHTTLTAPLYLRFDWEGEEARAPDGRHLRVLVLLDEGAEATLVEAHTGTPGFSTIVSEVRLATGARLTHVRLDRLGTASRQSAITLGELDSAASYNGFYLSGGGRFSRHEALLELKEKDAQAQLDGIYLVADGRHCDNTTVITHAGEDTVEPAIIPGRPHRGFAGCLSGLHPGEARSAKNRCASNEPYGASIPASRDRDQARTRDSGRQRQMQPRRYGGRTRFRGALLFARAWHS